MHRGFLWITILFLWTCQLQTEAPVSYNQDIRPIFNQKCLPCHGGIKQSGGFSLLFEEEAFANTDSGQPAIIRGDAAQSELFKRLRHPDSELRMPLDKTALSETEIQLIEKWINQGAKWEQHWAYSSPNPAIQPPIIADTAWANNGIDHFISQRLAQDSLLPNAEMDKASLLRRLSLDLIGLPPNLAESEAFLANTSENAYELEVDRLLNSPHFGERWASMWMDLARYADSKGYEKDLYRSIWKYRDWLIQAFNQDMPFQQFTIEQLAGDLLPNPTESQLIATAFHRNTMANDEGGTDDEEFRNYANIERVGTTFEVWQATTMSCVQCHSHPYDPFKHEDFYSFMSFFNNTVDRDIYHEAPNIFTYEGKNKQEVQEIIAWIQQRLKPADELPLKGFLHQQKTDLVNHLGYRKVEIETFDAIGGFIELTAPEQKTIFQVQDSSWLRFEQIDLTNIEAISYRYVTPYGGFIEVHLDSLDGPMISNISLPLTANAKASYQQRWNKWRTLKVPIEATTGKHDIYLFFRKDKIADADLLRLDWLYFHEQSPKLAAYNQSFQKKLAQLDAVESVPTPILQELPLQKRRKNHLFERGNWLVQGKEVKEAVPEILGQLPKDLPPNRLAMAKWLTSPENPLTARVIVNRLWEQLFGYGIIESLEDFGTQSLPPSHPELLDWLAVQFTQQHQGSIKQALKQIVLSAAYRQNNYVSKEKLAKDPRNRLLSRGPRIRLNAEQLRDQILSVSDALNPTMYGPSVQPQRPAGTDQFRFGDAFKLSTTENQNRRSLYTYVKRTNPFPNQITFDGTDRTTCASRRIRTNTPLQALALLNDPVYMDAARTIGHYMDTLTVDSELDRLKMGYQKVLLRPPNDAKLQDLFTLYKEAKKHYKKESALAVNLVAKQTPKKEELAALTMVAHALLNLDEFVNN
ncbi:MAG: DUF1553 domain-containing protein [Saprospiraceae bacterium]